jgi:predicted Abi (CAAX) family protease
MTPEQIALALNEDIRFNNGLILEYTDADILIALRLLKTRRDPNPAIEQFFLNMPDDTNNSRLINFMQRIKMKFRDEIMGKGFGPEVEKRPFKTLTGDPTSPDDRLVSIMRSIATEQAASEVQTPKDSKPKVSKIFEKPKAKQWAATQASIRLDTKLDQQP